MKNKNTIQVIDLRFHVDHMCPKLFQLSEEFLPNPEDVNAGFFGRLIRHRQIEMISDRKRN